ncbi:MAG: membrane protein insertion efficiency factor YidD [Rhodobiaceae bacterium]|nr:membrane protein insertion efficiency factor YidD [Rhodobiaceae bacterium]
MSTPSPSPAAPEEGGGTAAPPLHVRIALIVLRAYQLTFSAIMGRHCRYLPTCSEYTRDAILAYGLWAGSWIGLARILRCHPLGASGYDPIPERLPDSSRWYKPWTYGRWTGRHITTRLS